MISELVNGVGYSILLGLLGWVSHSIYRFNRELLQQEKRIIEEVGKMVSREKTESVLAHRRIGILDQTVGDITEEKFDSRIVAAGSQPPPKISRALKKLLSSD